VKSLSSVDDGGIWVDAMRLRIHGGVIDATRYRDIVRCVAVSDVLQQPLLKLSLQPLHRRFCTVCSPCTVHFHNTTKDYVADNHYGSTQLET